jgi:pimeloyl-ACP methyl ester carboxylesterase
MSKIEVNGNNFHYWQLGEGPDLILLHGLAGNLAVWHLKMVPELRKHFRVTTYDLRGHGRSDAPPTGYTTRDMADDLVGLMDALGIESAYLVGHSLGADIVLHTGLIYPERVRRMVLIEAGVPALVNIRKQQDWEGWRYWAELIEKFSGVKVPKEKWTDLGYMVKMTAEVPIIYGPARGLPRKKDGVERLLYQTSVMTDYEVVGELTLDNLPKIPHPKLLIYDGGSPYMHSYEVLEKLLTNCQPILLPPSENGHFGPLEQPELIVERIFGFFPADKETSAS